MYNFRRVKLNRVSSAMLSAGLLLVIGGWATQTANAQSSGGGGLLGRIAGGSGKAPAKGSSASKEKPAAKPADKPADKPKAQPEAPPAAKQPDIPAVSSEGYTGILIDARGMDIQRTPSCVIYGPEPDGETLYPDARHVPTPDEVQDASVVRYYLDEDAARKGVVGSNPMILKALDVVGPGHDCIRLSPEATAKLKALEKEIHLTLSWRVGILIPAGR